MTAIRLIRRGYGGTCTACGATVLFTDRARHLAWHAEITASLQHHAQGTSHDTNGDPTGRTNTTR